MANKFEQFAPTLESPFTGAEAVTPSDTVPFNQPSRGILTGTAGAMRVTMLDGMIVTIPSLAAGVIFPIRVKQVHADGTAAADIVIFW